MVPSEVRRVEVVGMLRYMRVGTLIVATLL
jgi:hypothetical protein